jgi:hypothetical protein
MDSLSHLETVVYSKRSIMPRMIIMYTFQPTTSLPRSNVFEIAEGFPGIYDCDAPTALVHPVPWARCLLL